MLRHILHDWNDADATRILATLRAAIGDTAVTLCLVEVEALGLLGFVSGLKCRESRGEKRISRSLTLRIARPAAQP